MFIDFEYTGLHQTTTPISLGIISECGKTFYAEFTDYSKTQIDDWLLKNVIDNLCLDTLDNQANIHNWKIKGVTKNIKEALEVWLSQFEEVVVWSDCLSYDWVLFCNIWGHAFNIPKNVYYIPMDICTLFDDKNIDPDISREEYCEINSVMTEERTKGLPKEVVFAKHNALWDAFIIRECYKKLTIF